MGKYYIGMDGGGTSTKVLVWDGERELLRMSAGGLNYNSQGPALVAEVSIAPRNGSFPAKASTNTNALGP